ncbi:hypothetical protein M0804_014061 [Polistes exclamans]|nr:hypothetical protein M0804_014062 [Polistes exclamans]KAI4475831.1 hypothetical protein M0804_014061 [Polistes exclamans]
MSIGPALSMGTNTTTRTTTPRRRANSSALQHLQGHRLSLRYNAYSDRLGMEKRVENEREGCDPVADVIKLEAEQYSECLWNNKDDNDNVVIGSIIIDLLYSSSLDIKLSTFSSTILIKILNQHG